MRLTNEFEKCILSFMESLIADFFNVLALYPNFYLCKRDWALDFVYTQFVNLLKFPHFLGRLTTREVPRTFSLW